MPIYDPKQEVSYLKEFMIFFRPGDIVKFKPVEREAYDQAVREVDSRTFRTFEAYAIGTVLYLVVSLLLMAGGAALARRTRLATR